MKNIIFTVIIIVLFSSCTIAFYDEDGFRLWRHQDFLTEDTVCVQSIDGYKAEGGIHIEGVFDKPVWVYNPNDSDIDVKVTDLHYSTWITLPSHESVRINDVRGIIYGD